MAVCTLAAGDQGEPAAVPCCGDRAAALCSQEHRAGRLLHPQGHPRPGDFLLLQQPFANPPRLSSFINCQLVQVLNWRPCQVLQHEGVCCSVDSTMSMREVGCGRCRCWRCTRRRGTGRSRSASGRSAGRRPSCAGAPRPAPRGSPPPSCPAAPPASAATSLKPRQSLLASTTFSGLTSAHLRRSRCHVGKHPPTVIYSGAECDLAELLHGPSRSSSFELQCTRRSVHPFVVMLSGCCTQVAAFVAVLASRFKMSLAGGGRKAALERQTLDSSLRLAGGMKMVFVPRASIGFSSRL